MKQSSTLAIIALVVGSASAFATSSPPVARQASCLQMSTSEQASSRRDALRTLSGAALATLAAATGSAAPASAKGYQETYLTEPTDEFKANEEKAMAFRREQLAIKGKFVDNLARITNASGEEDLVKDMKDLIALVKKTEGLPSGIKKDDIVKQIRAKKAKGFWPTSVEYEYQNLIREIAYQQSPNTEKEYF